MVWRIVLACVVLCGWSVSRQWKVTGDVQDGGGGVWPRVQGFLRMLPFIFRSNGPSVCKYMRIINCYTAGCYFISYTYSDN